MAWRGHPACGDPFSNARAARGAKSKTAASIGERADAGGDRIVSGAGLTRQLARPSTSRRHPSCAAAPPGFARPPCSPAPWRPQRAAAACGPRRSGACAPAAAPSIASATGVTSGGSSSAQRESSR
eukprot:1824700-Prymnesium_polylepis.1